MYSFSQSRKKAKKFLSESWWILKLQSSVQHGGIYLIMS